jgi:hypothetical protein
MKRTLLIAALVLTGCGGNQTQPQPGENSASGASQASEMNYEGLDGLPLDDFVVNLIPLLSAEPGIQNRDQIAAALGQKWNISCEQICRIKRK